MTDIIETKDFFEDKIDAIRLARKLANTVAFESATPALRKAAVTALGAYVYGG